MKDKDPRWQRFVALGIAVALGVACYVFRHRLGADFVPLDNSRVGPNLVAAIVQGAVVLIVLSLLYPPFSRAVHRFLDRKTAGLHDKLDALHKRHDAQEAKHDALLARVEELHAKLDAKPIVPAKVVPVRRARKPKP